MPRLTPPGVAVFVALVFAARGLVAQTTITLDGTSGSQSISTAYTLAGDTTFQLGFFTDYLVVGGGGAGGYLNGGGGGAGGLLQGTVEVATQSYGVVVGAGGVANTNQNTAGGNGTGSSWNGISAVGGGGGGGSKVAGSAGGSGGGAGATSSASGGAGTAGQGFAGGNDINASGDSHPGGGGGGGAGAVGGNNGTSPAYNGGDGGDGLQSSITGTSLYYAGGGGGGSDYKTPATAGGAGGLGGGGTGGYGVAGTAGTANTGGGGGGGDSDGTAGKVGGNGGSGVVILRYAGAEIAGVGVGSGVVHTTIGSDEYQVYSYTSPTPAVANAFDLSGVDLNARLGATLTTGITGTGNLTFAGPGSLTIAADSTFVGTTTISGGQLAIAGSLTSSAATVESGAELNIAGSITGSVTVDNGGTLAAGNSIDTLATGPVNFASGGIFGYEVDSSDPDLGTAADLMVTNGDLTIADGTILTFADIAGTPQAFPEDTTVFAMINYTGTYSGGVFHYAGDVLTDGSRFVADGQLWEIDYNYVYTPGSTIQPLNFSGSQDINGTYVTVTAVPEPSTYAMLLVAGGIATVTMRRRRR